MAFTTISSLTALSPSNVASGDVLPIVDVSAGSTKKIEAKDLLDGLLRVAHSTDLLSRASNAIQVQQASGGAADAAILKIAKSDGTVVGYFGRSNDDALGVYSAAGSRVVTVVDSTGPVITRPSGAAASGDILTFAKADGVNVGSIGDNDAGALQVRDLNGINRITIDSAGAVSVTHGSGLDDTTPVLSLYQPDGTTLIGSIGYVVSGSLAVRDGAGNAAVTLGPGTTYTFGTATVGLVNVDSGAGVSVQQASGLDFNAPLLTLTNGAASASHTIGYDANNEITQSAFIARRVTQLDTRKRQATDATEATGVLAATDLAITVRSGKFYSGRAVLFVDNTVAADGIQFTFDGGTATASAFFAGCDALTDSPVVQAYNTPLVLADLGTTNPRVFAIDFTFTADGDGTVMLRFAPNTLGGSGTATLHTGSFVVAEEVV